jgi:hypothetical protein
MKIWTFHINRKKRVIIEANKLHTAMGRLGENLEDVGVFGCSFRPGNYCLVIELLKVEAKKKEG